MPGCPQSSRSGKPLKEYKDHKQLLAVLAMPAGGLRIRRAKGLTANTVVELTKAEVAAIRETLAGMVCQAERLLRARSLALIVVQSQKAIDHDRDIATQVGALSHR